jgi:hypothetical protein
MGVETCTYRQQRLLLRGVIDHHFLDFKICSPVVLLLSIQYRQLLTHSSIKTVQHLIRKSERLYQGGIFLIFTAFLQQVCVLQAQLSRE